MCRTPISIFHTTDTLTTRICRRRKTRICPHTKRHTVPSPAPSRSQFFSCNPPVLPFCLFPSQGDNVSRVDKLLREGFESLVLQAEAGLLTPSWSKRPRSLVALILLLDQFSRSAAAPCTLSWVSSRCWRLFSSRTRAIRLFRT